MISKFEGKKFDELVKGGLAKLATMGSAAPSGAAPAGAKAGAVAAVEEKKEEVEDVDMGGLFGGDDEY